MWRVRWWSGSAVPVTIPSYPRGCATAIIFIRRSIGAGCAHCRAAKAWSLPDIAALAHVSPRHLNTRFFQSHLGISVRDYLEQLRLAVAEQWLLQGAAWNRPHRRAGFSSPRQYHRARQRSVN